MAADALTRRGGGDHEANAKALPAPPPKCGLWRVHEMAQFLAKVLVKKLATLPRRLRANKWPIWVHFKLDSVLNVRPWFC